MVVPTASAFSRNRMLPRNPDYSIAQTTLQKCEDKRLTCHFVASNSPGDDPRGTRAATREGICCNKLLTLSFRSSALNARTPVLRPIRFSQLDCTPVPRGVTSPNPATYGNKFLPHINHRKIYLTNNGRLHRNSKTSHKIPLQNI